MRGAWRVDRSGRARPTYEAVVATLADSGKILATMHPEESLWQARTGHRGVTSSIFYNRFRRHLAAGGLQQTGVHILGHAAAKLRRHAGGSIESVS